MQQPFLFHQFFLTRTFHPLNSLPFAWFPDEYNLKIFLWNINYHFNYSWIPFKCCPLLNAPYSTSFLLLALPCVVVTFPPFVCWNDFKYNVSDVFIKRLSLRCNSQIFAFIILLDHVSHTLRSKIVNTQYIRYI